MKLFLPLLLIFTLPAFGQFRCQDQKSNGIYQASKANLNSINNNGKSDTIDILHYHLDLNLFSISSSNLKGVCSINFSPKMANVNSLELDLLKLQVDSIMLDGTQLAYHHNDTTIRVQLGANYSSNDTLKISVYYGGTPPVDGSGWGGFHVQSGYYFNLGVGFAADPHTYGRSWFPCFDNFVERSTYSFKVLTKNPLNSYCNGLRTKLYTHGVDSVYSEWALTNEIPTYLASVAVSNYKELKSSVNGLQANIPVWLMSKAADTANVKTAFQNINPILHSFEGNFGPYQWEKIAYCMTTIGAMEHATSIHFPINLINGTLAGEDIIAHELAHHWFGNLITCETADDMWINEGMAEFLSHLYSEQVYSREKYIQNVRANANLVLNTAHVNDQGYRSIYGLPHEYVYGTHVYQKGAMVGHNLRAYLGDDLFFNGLSSLLQNNAYKNLNTADFESQLSSLTSYPLNNFFNDWVLNPGFPSFSIDSLHYNFGSQELYIKVVQNVRAAPALFQNVPVEVSLFDQNGDTTNVEVSVNGKFGSLNISNFPYHPEFALASYSGKLLSGDTYDEHEITQIKYYQGSYSKLRISANTVTDTSKIIIVQHWAGPNNNRMALDKDYRISNARFWTLRGFDFENADISARLNYNGSTNGLDGGLTVSSEDSLMVLYRKYPWERWELFPHQIKTDLGSSTNGIGYFDLDHLQEGDYVLANTAERVNLVELKIDTNQVEIYPNPAKSLLQIKILDTNKNHDISIFDATGKRIFSKEVPAGASGNIDINLKSIKSTYLIVQVNAHSQKVVLGK